MEHHHSVGDLAETRRFVPIASLKDDAHVEIRPYQFLWTFHSKKKLETVISFVCNEHMAKHDFSVLLDNQVRQAKERLK